MKKGIHPEYKVDFELNCSTCQTNHKFGSTAVKATVDVCAGCHPFYTGDRNFSRVTGRIQRFKRLLEKQNKTQK